MGKYSIVPAKISHAALAMECLSPDIKEELAALSPTNTLLLLENNIKGADESWSVFSDEGIICIFGIGSGTLMDENGYPWFIATTRLMKHKKNFLIGTHVVLEEWLKRYSVLKNYVPAKFTAALRWLKWAGFTLYPPKPIGVGGQLIHEVVLRRDSV